MIKWTNIQNLFYLVYNSVNINEYKFFATLSNFLL